MPDYGTIKLPREDYERHNEDRKRAGLTWAEYLDAEAADVPAATIDEDRLADILAERLPERIARDLESRLR